jgi:hypothetical protein
LEIKKKSIAILTISILLASALGVISSINTTLANNEPTYEAADVDGDYGEWDIPGDFFATMGSGAECDGPSYGTNLYLRADCQCGYVILYILVLDTNSPEDPILVQGCDEAWVKIDGDKVVCSDDGDDDDPPDFAWIGLFGDSDEYAEGYEASVILANGEYLLNVHVNSENGESETQCFGGPLTIACTPEDCCDDPPVCDVITWVVAGGTSTPTAFGTYVASWIDATAGGVLLGMSCDGRPAFDIDPAVVDQGDGTPQVGSIVVTSGGPAVNALEKYYEVNRISPVYYHRETGATGTEMVWRDSGDDSYYELTRTTYSDIGEDYDVFIVQQFDDDGTPVIMVYGIEGRGTLAGAHYYYANAGFFEGKQGWWVYEWIDDPVNGSIGHPDYGDTDEFNLLDSGGV